MENKNKLHEKDKRKDENGENMFCNSFAVPSQDAVRLDDNV